METLRQDLRYAVRALAKSPGFTLVATLTLALGIAAPTVVFSLVDALLLRPLPVPAPERLVTVEEVRQGPTIRTMGQAAYSFDRYLELREEAGASFSGLAAQRYRDVSVSADGTAGTVNGVVVSANYFDVLGVRPSAGRFFSVDADRAGAPAEAVISHAYWHERFGGDPGVVGRTVRIDSRPVQVVGVAPAKFGGTLVGIGASVWLPVGAQRAPASAPSGIEGQEWVGVFGRLRPGVSPQQAAAQMEVLSRRMAEDTLQARVERVRVEAISRVPSGLRAPAIGFTAMLLATAALVLLIAAVNVAGMLLARAVARRREMAIRLAVGAGRGRLVGQLLTESMLLFLLAGGGGLLLTAWLTRLLAAYHPPTPIRIDLDLSVDGRVMAFALLVALGTGLVFGMTPALQATRTDLVRGLREGETGRATSRSGLRSAFVVTQLAMSLLLLITAGLFARTLQSTLGSDPGFDPEGVAVAGINLSSHGYDGARASTVYRRLLDGLATSPEVESVALARIAPLSGDVLGGEIEAEVPGAGKTRLSADFNVIDPEYLRTLRIDLRAGRDFTPADGEGAPAAAIVNETLARRLWANESPLGKRFVAAGVEREVVGVVGDAKYSSYRDEGLPFYYLPIAQNFSADLTLLVRGRGEPAATLAAIGRELESIDPDLTLRQPMPLPAMLDFMLLPQRMAATLIGVFGLVGLLLAGTGIYGILAYHVSQRTREIGIRMALGATARGVLGLVVSQGLALTGLGIAGGLLLAFAATRLLSSLVYGVSVTDPLTFMGVPLLLAVVAMAASYLPARRAIRVDPMVALRSE
jgi:predicted permease